MVGWFYGLLIKTDNTAYQALVLVWLGCGNYNKFWLPILIKIGNSLEINNVVWVFGSDGSLATKLGRAIKVIWEWVQFFPKS